MNSAILLLVDAASESRDSWKSFLQNQNYDVFTAEDGESALRECVQPQSVLILLLARNLQIADIYDALVTDRPYRDALSSEDALETLRTEAGYGWLDTPLVWKVSRICREGEYFPARGRTMLASYYA